MQRRHETSIYTARNKNRAGCTKFITLLYNYNNVKIKDNNKSLITKFVTLLYNYEIEGNNKSLFYQNYANCYLNLRFNIFIVKHILADFSFTSIELFCIKKNNEMLNL